MFYMENVFSFLIFFTSNLKKIQTKLGKICLYSLQQQQNWIRYLKKEKMFGTPKQDYNYSYLSIKENFTALSLSMFYNDMQSGGSFDKIYRFSTAPEIL